MGEHTRFQVEQCCKTSPTSAKVNSVSELRVLFFSVGFKKIGMGEGGETREDWRSRVQLRVIE